MGLEDRAHEIAFCRFVHASCIRNELLTFEPSDLSFSGHPLLPHGLPDLDP
jgi:hypothetical protein